MRTYYSNDRRKCAEMTYESQYMLDPKYMTKRDLQYYYRYYNVSQKRSQCKRFVLVIFCLCFFSYLFLDYNLKANLWRLRNRFDFVARLNAVPEDGDNHTHTPIYFVDTPGCRIPYFAVSDELIEQYVYAPHNYTCRRKPLTRSNSESHELWANLRDTQELRTVYNISGGWGSIRCRYASLQQQNAQWHPFELRPEIAVPVVPHSEFVRVECYTAATPMPFYRDCHFFAPHQALDKTTTPTQPERISVMLLGISSLSHLNFLRQMKHSARFVRDKLAHVEFWGHNKVAGDSHGNLLPALTGLDVSELDMACPPAVGVTSSNSSLDRCPLVWRRYKQAGYQTALIEDMAGSSLGARFTESPVDYGLQPLLHVLAQSNGQHPRDASQQCLGERRAVDLLLEYVRQLVPRMLQGDFFAHIWSASGSARDDLNMAALLDKQLLQLLEQLSATGVTNRTLIFLMSDHGMRWGSFRQTYQGMMEERQPLFIVLHPAWFASQYPLALRNLRANAKRLTTPFDLHATLVDLLDVRGKITDGPLQLRAAELNESITSDNMPRAISLFLPIPESRACDMAGITTQWCTCHQREQLPTNDNRVQLVARYVVKRINARLRGHPECRVLHLHSIISAVVAAPHHKIVHNIRTDYSSDFTLYFQTKPGLAEYETTVRMSANGVYLTAPITRRNLYTSQSYCVDDAALKVFCYCPR